MELGGKLGQVCALELGGRLEPVYELVQRGKQVCVLVPDGMELACVLALELHSLHKKHQQCIQRSDQQCILHVDAYHREGVHCNRH